MGGGLIDTHMNTNSFKINQRIKKINVFDFFDFFDYFHLRDAKVGGGTHRYTYEYKQLQI